MSKRKSRSRKTDNNLELLASAGDATPEPAAAATHAGGEATPAAEAAPRARKSGARRSSTRKSRAAAGSPVPPADAGGLPVEPPGAAACGLAHPAVEVVAAGDAAPQPADELPVREAAVADGVAGPAPQAPPAGLGPAAEAGKPVAVPGRVAPMVATVPDPARPATVAPEKAQSLDAVAMQPRPVAGGEIRLETMSYGKRLAHARKRMGLSQVDVATRLKLPYQRIVRLEQDDYEGLAQAVFLRGYLMAYARLVGLPEDEAARVAEAHAEEAPLVATGAVSRSRYLFDRYAMSATYMVLTAIIVVPAVWLATHGGLQREADRTTPLDPPAASAPAQQQPRFAEQPGSIGVPPTLVGFPERAAEGTGAPEAGATAPLIASMAPFPSSRAPTGGAAATASQPPAAAPGGDAPADVIGSGRHLAVLTLAGQSWVEVTTAEGSRLEYAMLNANSRRSYRSDGPLTVRLGNAVGASITSDGRPVDLAAFQRGNVAHVELFAPAAAGDSPAQ